MASRHEIEPHERKGYIYGLHDGDGAVRYVGQTCRLKARMTEHIIHSRDPRKRTSEGAALSDWIVSIDVMHVRLLAVDVPESKLNDAEKEWIARFGLDNLLNRTPGGFDVQRGNRSHWFGRKHTAETRAKMGLHGAAHPAYGKPSPLRRFTEAEKAVICERVANGELRKAIAAEFGVSRATVEAFVPPTRRRA